MERKYWEKMAPAYNDEIFDVLYNDKNGIIRAAIKKLASPSKTVIDVGCAVGKWLPVLFPAFKKVIAIDISAKNLTISQKNYPQFRKVEYLQSDMSAGKTKLPKSDLAICINAILTESLKKRNMFFKNLSLCVKKNGHIILVVPSLESWLYTRIIQNQWKIDKALFDEKLSGKESIKRYRNIQQGNVEIDNVATKHYLREELMLLLSQEAFAIEDCKKIEYSWNTEFIKPPKWLHKPGPWDWMIIARKNK